MRVCDCADCCAQLTCRPRGAHFHQSLSSWASNGVRRRFLHFPTARWALAETSLPSLHALVAALNVLLWNDFGGKINSLAAFLLHFKSGKNFVPRLKTADWKKTQHFSKKEIKPGGGVTSQKCCENSCFHLCSMVYCHVISSLEMKTQHCVWTNWKMEYFKY